MGNYIFKISQKFGSTIVRNCRGLLHKINTSDSRLCVLEESGNQYASKTVVFVPGALGSLKTDFRPQFAKGSPFQKYRQICFEPAGYGRSRPPNRTWPPADFFQQDARDLGFCLDQIGIESLRVMHILYSFFGDTSIQHLPRKKNRHTIGKNK